jgi:acetylornithine/N-succinyldiaminopimelate aminotransferase
MAVAALRTLEIMAEEKLLENAARMGDLLKREFAAALAGVAGVKDIRGMGLMMGIELDRPCADVVKIALDHGVFTNVTQDSVVRLLPPLIINEAEAKEMVVRISIAIKAFLGLPQKVAA